MPEDVFCLFKIQTTDEEEFTNLQSLKEIFLSTENQMNFENDFQENLNSGLAQYQLDYAKDIKPFLGEKIEIAIGVGGDFENEITNVYFIQKIGDLNKYAEIIKKLLEQKVIFAIEGGYQISVSEKEDYYFTEKNGYLIATNSLEEFVRMLVLEVKESLVYNENYVHVRENLPTSFSGLAYLNAETFFAEIQKAVLKQKENTDPEIKAFFEGNHVDLLSSLGGILSLQNDGVNFLSYIEGDKKTMDKLDFYFDKIPNQNPVFEKKLPGEELLFYFEIFDLKTKIQEFEANLKKNDEVAYKTYAEQKKQAGVATGLNFEEDILSWLDRALAVSVQDTGTIVPGITLAIDVNGNASGAGKLLETLDSFVSIALVSLKEYQSAILQEEVVLGKSVFKQISILPENLPAEVQEQGEMVSAVLGDLKILYGITDENILILTTSPNFTETYQNETIAQNPTYKQLSSKIEKKGQGVFFFSPEVLANYLDFWLESNQTQEMMSEADQATFDVLSGVLKHFKGLLSSAVAHKYTYESQGFLKIGY